MSPTYREVAVAAWASDTLSERAIRVLLERFGPTAIYDPDAIHTCIHSGEKHTASFASLLGHSPAEWLEKAGALRDALARRNVSLVVVGDPSYPTQLAVDGAPAILSVRGSTAVLGKTQIAIVGTRKPLECAKEACQRITEELVHRGVVVTSGGARGIDWRAHRTAIDGGGKTVVVFGTGINRVYPREHEQLFDEVVDKGGALVSQFSPGAGGNKGRFPRRNAVIAALSVATVVIQAPVNSGALHTATAARLANRPVFAMVAPPLIPGFEGGHGLLAQRQAEPFLDIEALFVGAAPPRRRQRPLFATTAPRPTLDGVQRQVWEALSEGPVSRERLSLLGPGVPMAILDLELLGLVEVLAGARLRRTSDWRSP